MTETFVDQIATLTAVPFDTGNVEAKLEEIAELLRRQDVPWEARLWTAADVGAYCDVSARTVAERWAPRPDFPRPVRVAGGHARWYASEIVDWVAKFQSNRR